MCITREIVEDAVQEWSAGILAIQATFRSDAPDKIAGDLLIDEAELIEGAERSEEAGWIAGATRRGESGRSAAERTESAAAARTAATS
jgi:hypothetical protein